MFAVKVNLPYAATAGSVTLPAGQYTIETLGSDETSAPLLFRSQNGDAMAVVSAVPTTSVFPRQYDSRVELQKVDGKYQIDKVFMEGRSVGVELYQSESK